MRPQVGECVLGQLEQEIIGEAFDVLLDHLDQPFGLHAVEHRQITIVCDILMADEQNSPTTMSNSTVRIPTRKGVPAKYSRRRRAP